MLTMPPQHLSTVEKERYIVENLDITDLLQFSSCPYHFNAPLQKSFGEHSHPFAYIDLDIQNQIIAISELYRLNKIILQTGGYVAQKDQLIDTSAIAFYESNPYCMPTHLRFFPYTLTGKIQKYPLCLNVVSHQIPFPQFGYDLIGYLYYSASGNLDKADVHIWMPSITLGGIGYYFETIDGALCLYRVTSGVPHSDGTLNTVYRCPHLIRFEEQKALDLQDYSWLQKNLPDVCPKSFSGYRRMKSANSKKYQSIQLSAHAHGRDI